MMKKPSRIVVFRFHGHFDVCRNHLELFRMFNSKTRVFGLFGGPEKLRRHAHRLALDDLWHLPIDDPYWKWLNGDLALRWWYKEVGHKIDFDIIHLIEWDCLLLDDIDKRFAHLRDGVALANLTSTGADFDRWNWTAPIRGRWEVRKLINEIRKTHRTTCKLYRCITPGAILSREFIDRYSKIEIASLCNDEVRVPLYAQAFKMPLADTGCGGQFFTASDTEFVSAKQVLRNYEVGIVAFHPVKVAVDIAAVDGIRRSMLGQSRRRH